MSMGQAQGRSTAKPTGFVCLQARSATTGRPDLNRTMCKVSHRQDALEASNVDNGGAPTGKVAVNIVQGWVVAHAYTADNSTMQWTPVSADHHFPA
jgi:hypothetical protein